MDEPIRILTTGKRPKLSPKSARRLAWAAWGISILLLLSATFIWFLDQGNLPAFFKALFTGMPFACFGTAGALIVSQRPENPIGWIFCLVGIGTGITDLSGAYAAYGTLNGHPLLSGSGILSWLGDTVWPLNWGLMLIFLPLLLPHGRPLTRRWRIVGWLAALMGFLAVLMSQLAYIGQREKQIGRAHV